jgi:ribosomal protein L34E
LAWRRNRLAQFPQTLYPVHPANCQLLLHCCGPVRSKYPKKHRLLGPTETARSAHPRNLPKSLCRIPGGAGGKNIPIAHGRQNDAGAAKGADKLPASFIRLRSADRPKRISRTRFVATPGAGLRAAATRKAKARRNCNDGGRNENHVGRIPARADILLLGEDKPMAAAPERPARGNVGNAMWARSANSYRAKCIRQQCG